MPYYQLPDLPKRDGESYRDALITREPDRLAELSHWILSTQGPWNDLDASLDSLRPLWVWFMDFVNAGCPGIPIGAHGMNWVAEPHRGLSKSFDPALTCEVIA
ncbi:hypothetical protein [Kineosporia sp. NBRC 101731]|uniref:hypothetical protein n=1 Tax=Kineosporia sp. NBRC 101731 TaxID=3032199 RepID=UPI0024A0A8D9|nr:hypothetical protein [Kineosporia sp. NBRC 101731]GLY33884.1 hypothetical protein Kisp02_72490 [Kineosporia sp. NBRC 101731]